MARLTLTLWLMLPLLGGCLPAAVGWQIGQRDGFVAFVDPPTLSAEAAEQGGQVRPREMVIGVAQGGEARAYPIAMMGIHELGNDTVGGVPIVLGW